MIGSLRVIGESSIAAGVRRIEAVTAEAAENYVFAQQDMIRDLRAMFNNLPNLAQAVKKSIDENAEMKKQLEAYVQEKAVRLKEEIVANAKEEKGVKLFQYIGKGTTEILKNIAFQVKGETEGTFAFVAGILEGEKCALMIMLSDDLVAGGLNAGKIVREAAKHIQGGGGGQPHFATAGGKNPEALQAAIDKAVEIIMAKINE